MAPKRALDNETASTTTTTTTEPAVKKARKGFRVGPDNLPDGPWRRKVTKIKQDLIQKAKIKKAYSKIKAAELREQPQQQEEGKGSAAAAAREEENNPESTRQAPPSPQIHPSRQAMLDGDEENLSAEDSAAQPPRHQRKDRPRRQQQRKPGYYDKALAQAERKKAEQAEREDEVRRRTEERERKTAERDRFRKAMVKAKAPGRDGRRRLGRESGLLLERVKRMSG